MSTAARITWLAAGAVAVTLILAAAISAAMDGGNALPALAHRVAIRATTGGEAQPGDDRGQAGAAAPPAAIDTSPVPAAGFAQDEPEPGDGQDRDRHRGRDGDRGDGHDSSDGRR